MKIGLDVKYLKSELLSMLSSRYLLNDIFAGIMVGIIAIPLSLSIAFASSVPVEYALISAVIGGIIVAFLGGSKLSITGPAVAMTILIAQAVQSYGLMSLVVIGIICGGLQLLCGVLRFGRINQFIPDSVVTGFISAIGIILFFSILPNIFNLHSIPQANLYHQLFHLNNYIHNANFMVFGLSILTIILFIIGPKFISKALTLIVATAIPTAIVYIFHLSDVALIYNIPHSLPLSLTLFPLFQFDMWRSVMLTGVVVFILASLETLLSNQAVDKLLHKENHVACKPNQELIGQGIANIVVALFGGLPVTSVITRSSINIDYGAKTRRAAIIQALVILLCIYFFYHIIELIPVFVLSCILIIASLRMINVRGIVKYWQHNKLDLLIYLVTLFTILSSDALYGIQVGILLAVVIVIIKALVSRSEIKLWTNQSIMRITLRGNLLLWDWTRLDDVQEQIFNASSVKCVVFEFQHMQYMDTNGAQYLIALSNEIVKHGVQVIFHAVNPNQHKLLTIALEGNQPKYNTTVTEHEIKLILEKSNIPYNAIDILKQGLSKFSESFIEDNQQLITTLSKGQNPHTLFITCSDSRLDPNVFFSSTLGELFIVRNVGNVIPEYSSDNTYSEIAAIEFALTALQIRNIVICAHTACGAVVASLANLHDNTQATGLDRWLQLIKNGYTNKAIKDTDEGVKINLINQVQHLKTYPSVQTLLNNNQLMITGWVYDIHSATVSEWNPTTNTFSII